MHNSFTMAGRPGSPFSTLLLALAAIFAAFSLCLGSAGAQQGTRVIVNGGMEFGVANNALSQLDADFGFGATFDNGSGATNPWFTSHPTQVGGCAAGSVGDCHPIETWGTGFNGVPAHGGSNFIELNAFTASMVYQNVCFATNESITYSFAHRARQGTDQAFFRVKSQANALIQDLRTVSTTTAAWVVYSNTITYTGAAGVQRLGFESGTTGSGNITVGNFLDTISITLNPLADLAGSTSSTAAEGASLGSLFIRLNGTASSAVTIALQRTAPSTGTAAAENDFTIAGSGGVTVSHTAGTDIWLVTIPSGGVYDGGVVPGSGANNPADGVSLTVTAATDTTLEAQEGFRLQILDSGSNGSSTNWTSADPVCANNRVQQTGDFFITGQSEIRVAKISNGSTGTFAYALTNADTDLVTAGTQNAASITTATAGTQTFYDANSSLAGIQGSAIVTPGTAVTITETIPSTWDLTSATCVDASSNPVAGTSLSGGVLTVPAAATGATALLTCTFTNSRQADLSIQKTNTPASGNNDQTNDTVAAGATTTYTLTVTNSGPGAVTGAVVRDTPTAGLSCPGGNSVSCSPAAACSGPYTVSGLTGSSGITLGTLASGAAATLAFNCTVQ